MIPKVIHYCWFGGKPLPELARRCLASWQKFLPDYAIKQWNEQNYDVTQVPFVKDAYEAGNYSYVSDYVRFDVLYREGGIYFDADVEVEKDGNSVSGKSIMALMTLEATCGTVLKVTASGPQAAEVLEELEALVARKFDIPDEQ